MRMIILILSIALPACAKDKKDEPVCVKEFNLLQYQFADGSIRKTEKTVCSNGCTTYQSMDVEPLKEQVCN